jgi:hypothetical protein
MADATQNDASATKQKEVINFREFLESTAPGLKRVVDNFEAIDLLFTTGFDRHRKIATPDLELNCENCDGQLSLDSTASPTDARRSLFSAANIFPAFTPIFSTELSAFAKPLEDNSDLKASDHARRSSQHL